MPWLAGSTSGRSCAGIASIANSLRYLLSWFIVSTKTGPSAFSVQLAYANRWRSSYKRHAIPIGGLSVPCPSRCCPCFRSFSLSIGLLLILGSTVDRHVEHLDQRWSEACHNAPSAAFPSATPPEPLPVPPNCGGKSRSRASAGNCGRFSDGPALVAAEGSALAGFAGGLMRDLAAVRAALSLPWSTGPVEGRSAA